MNSKVIEMIKYAYSKVPFYIDYAETHNIKINDSYQMVPFINKNEIINDCEKLISVEQIANYYNNKLLYTSTTGTTGECLHIFKSYSDNRKSMLELWIRRYYEYGIKPNDKMCYFYTNRLLQAEEKCYKGVVFQQYNNILAISKSSIEIENIKSIHFLMEKFGVIWCIFQPGIANVIISGFRKNRLKKIETVKYIEFTGEMLSNIIRNDVEKYFDCVSANQYGCNELNSIAFECKEGNLHCMSSNVFVEIIDNGKSVIDKEGEIYVTSLCNRTMPFIRYGLGDVGSLIIDHHCNCGNKNPILKLSYGRKSEYIKNRDGSQTNIYCLLKPIHDINEIDDLIKQFKIIQIDFELFEIQIVLNEDCVYGIEQIKDMFINFLEERKLKKCEYRFKELEYIFPEISGKNKCFICNI